MQGLGGEDYGLSGEATGAEVEGSVAAGGEVEVVGDKDTGEALFAVEGL